MRTDKEITNYDYTELKELMEQIINYIAADAQDIREGVKEMGGKVLEFEHDILMKESEAQGIAIGEAQGIEIGKAQGVAIGEAQGIEIGKAKSLTSNVASVMKKLNISLAKACELLEITVDDYQKAKGLISK